MSPIVTILTIDTIDICKEERLALQLPAQTQARLRCFTHEARRRQTLWGRLVALSYARTLGFKLVETPPYSPILVNGKIQRSLSIAHTGNTIAVGLSCELDPIIGLDIERLRPVRSVRDMCCMSFGQSVTWAADKYDENGSLEPFFLLWGMKESAIKLNRGTERFRLTASATGTRPDVIDTSSGSPLLVHHTKIDDLRLTVLTGREEPEYHYALSSTFNL